MRLNTYLNFPGTCKEAFERYHAILGGEITAMMAGDSMPDEFKNDPTWQGRVMHACLTVGGMDLMGSDVPDEHFQTPQGYSVSIHIDDEGEADRIFTALADGGNVTMPLEPTFWAKKFGQVTDKFGINWMVDCG